MTPHPSSRETTVPVARPRPAFDHWCREHGFDDQGAADFFGTSRQTINLLRRPFDDPKRRRPGGDLLTEIVRRSRGGVRPEDFSPPVSEILRGVAA